jgi:hypothetical protein
MQLRNRKINSSSKHQLKNLYLNKQYFQNDLSDTTIEQISNSCSYIDPNIVGCKKVYDSDTSINLQIFLKNIFFGIMLFSMYASIFTYSLHSNNYNTLNTTTMHKYELVPTKPDYYKINAEGLKIVSVVFSSNNIKTKYILSKNIKNLFNSLVKLDKENHDIPSVYQNWLSHMYKFTNSSMFKLDEYIWMKNGNVSNSFSTLKYATYNPQNYVGITIHRNESIHNTILHPYLIVL